MSSERLVDLGKPVHRVRGRGIFIKLSLSERVRAARGVAQAVVKVVSYAHGLKRVRQLIDYISRKGTLELETETGERITGRDQGTRLAENWSGDFDVRKDSRDAAHVVFSMPRGSSPEALRNSIRMVLAKEFSGHEAVFGIHQDKSHPHAHVVVKMRGLEKEKKLRLNKPELYRLREVFAEVAREQGVPLAASPRAARGVGRKGVRQAVYQLRQKGITPRVQKEAAQEAIMDLTKGATQEKPWEQAMSQRYILEREAYRKAAAALRVAAEKPERQLNRERHLKAANQLEQFAQTMPKPETRRQAWMKKVRQKIKERRKEKSKTQSRDVELER